MILGDEQQSPVESGLARDLLAEGDAPPMLPSHFYKVNCIITSYAFAIFSYYRRSYFEDL